ncbi:MAG: hypothetical protein NVV82_20410 [Sporocytophaga sp.]|nr:hypothetical protein [Sporocytophaga sp.]
MAQFRPEGWLNFTGIINIDNSTKIATLIPILDFDNFYTRHAGRYYDKKSQVEIDYEVKRDGHIKYASIGKIQNPEKVNFFSLLEETFQKMQLLNFIR